MTGLVILLYFVSLGYVFVFSLGQFYLSLQAKKFRKPEVAPLNSSPIVTIQLPVYNEKYVVARLIDAVCQIDYPRAKLEIQVLDDSTDETSEIIADKVAFYRETGLNIQHIQREKRTGFKAGALQYGVEKASGEFIAIFDADFVPPPDFLTHTLPHFSREDIGMVQTPWTHINLKYNLLTRLQAVGLNGHFNLEHPGRINANALINFNGTGGVWRKKCIIDAGGWSHDTLTEDLDLSYRAQLNGWKFIYEDKVQSPAELPVYISAIKSQQYRWNKGAAETAMKHIGNVWKAAITRKQKALATLHLLNSSVYIFIFIASILSVPILLMKHDARFPSWVFHSASLFLLGFVAITFFYWQNHRKSSSHPASFLIEFPAFLSFTLGLSLHNARAVTLGFLGVKSDFHRTPKFAVTNQKLKKIKNDYLRKGVPWMSIFEIAFSFYFIFGIYKGIVLHDGGLLLFHTLLTAGFLMIGLSGFRQYATS